MSSGSEHLKSTRQYVFEGMELLPTALIPFVERRLESSLSGHWQVQVVEKLPSLRPDRNGRIEWDQSALFNAMDRFWSEAFKAVLGRAERSLINELVDVRNKLSHNVAFSYDDAERALDSMRRLMEAISAGEVASELRKSRDTILRAKFTESQRNEEQNKSTRHEVYDEGDAPEKVSSTARARTHGNTIPVNGASPIPLLKLKGWADKPTLKVHRVIALVAARAPISRDQLVREIDRFGICKNSYGTISSLMTNKGNSYGLVLVENTEGRIDFHPDIKVAALKLSWRVPGA